MNIRPKRAGDSIVTHITRDRKFSSGAAAEALLWRHSCQTAEQHLNYKSLVNHDYFSFTKVKHELPKGKLNSPQANTD